MYCTLSHIIFVLSSSRFGNVCWVEVYTLSEKNHANTKQIKQTQSNMNDLNYKYEYKKRCMFLLGHCTVKGPSVAVAEIFAEFHVERKPKPEEMYFSDPKIGT